jgi:hypothetical protein
LKERERDLPHKNFSTQKTTHNWLLTSEEAVAEEYSVMGLVGLVGLPSWLSR